MKHDNEPEHSTEITNLRKDSLYLNATEMLWGDFKRGVYGRNLCKITQLKEAFIEEWGKLSASCCQRLEDDYRKCPTD